VRLYPACPGNPRLRIEGESPQFGKDIRSSLSVSEIKREFEVGLSRHARLQSTSLKLSTPRFRAKIMLGFAGVLAISAVSMGLAYLGFERVSAGVASYRNSVLEADLARNIDRQLISYQALARYRGIMW
jgi:hypothetical protein